MEFLRSLYHYSLAWLGSYIYGRPSRNIFVIGVTGTKGKSTVIEIISAILEAAGKKTALISSVRQKIDDVSCLNMTGMSMPGRFSIQRFLKESVQSGCDYAIIEVTSQGIIQHRHRFIDFGGVIITNLEPEHIEAHGSFEKYRASKAKFFSDVALYSEKIPKLFFINSDMRDCRYFVEAVSENGKVIFYNKKDVVELKIKTKLIGEFNLENIAAAIAFARSRNIDWETIKNAIELFNGVPGRLEFVQKIPFSVVIDYAHTPDSLEKVYKTLKNQKVPACRRAGKVSAEGGSSSGGKSSKPKAGKLICVLGSAGGGRDAWKRPVMGKLAADYCNNIILTNEDPFNEDPENIVNEIASGVPEDLKNKVKIILDRKEAIRSAIKSAKKNDTVVITGKGSEPYMRIAGGKKIPWSEKEIALKILNNERIEI